MTSVSSILPPGLTQAQPLGATGGDNQLGQAAFLKLMTAQLKFQDPFDPVDNQAMVAQMAQFSSVAGIAEMNKSLQAIAAGFNTSRLSDAASFIGRSVLVEGDQALSDFSGSYRGEFTLAAPAQNVTLEYRNSEGQIVHRQEMGALPQGANAFQFNPVDEAGNPVNIGPLKVTITGAATTQLSTWVPVTGVESAGTGSDANLVTPVGNIAVSQAKRVS
jgi:flagellar basal-body rod modification protein FlgD